MDDLDRLAFRLVRTVRNSYPHLLAQEFTLTDLEERLLPFRETRREMSNNGPEVWELNVLRMVSGERDYLNTDADLQLACRQALTLPSPTLALVRPWSATTLRLGAAAGTLGNDRVQTQAGDAFTESALGLEYSATPLRLATPGMITTGTATRPHVQSESQALSPLSSNTTAAQHTSARNAAALDELRRITPGHTLRTCGCRFCGGKLPESRKLTFCPHCGVNLTVRQCPACSTELDVNWRFCVTCGRGADVPELPASLTQIAGTIAN
ncbi:MAG: zinc ribbon domain-containing protein [Gemmatimonas sp.]